LIHPHEEQRPGRVAFLAYSNRQSQKYSKDDCGSTEEPRWADQAYRQIRFVLGQKESIVVIAPTRKGQMVEEKWAQLLPPEGTRVGMAPDRDVVEPCSRPQLLVQMMKSPVAFEDLTLASAANVMIGISNNTINN
jgi:hypothetical protein